MKKQNQKQISYNRMIGALTTLGFALYLGLPIAQSNQTSDSKFESVFATVSATLAKGKIPVVISDLDETLVDSVARRYYSLITATQSICGTQRKGQCGHLAGINIKEIIDLPNHYNLDTLFTHVEVTDKVLLQKIGNGLVEHYLSGKKMDLDQAVPGATEFIQKLNDLHAKTFFVSSRYLDTQGKGTLDSLKNLGFIPTDSIGETIKLRTRGESSIDFKKAAFSDVQTWASENNGEVVLVMENEPENMNAMTDTFPDAKSIFVDGAFLKDLPITGNPMHISNFR